MKKKSQDTRLLESAVKHARNVAGTVRLGDSATRNRECVGGACGLGNTGASRGLGGTELGSSGRANIFASGEPRPMCAAAIYRCNIRRLVFCVSEPAMRALRAPYGRAATHAAVGAKRTFIREQNIKARD